MTDFDPHRAIPGTPMHMTPEQEQAWAENQAAGLAAAMSESRGAASVTLDTIIASVLGGYLDSHEARDAAAEVTDALLAKGRTDTIPVMSGEFGEHVLVIPLEAS